RLPLEVEGDGTGAVRIHIVCAVRSAAFKLWVTNSLARFPFPSAVSLPTAAKCPTSTTLPVLVNRKLPLKLALSVLSLSQQPQRLHGPRRRSRRRQLRELFT